MKKKTTQFINPFTDFGFKKLFGEERRAYEESVKQYRDLKNVTDSAFHDGEKKSDIKVILNGYQKGLSVELLASLTELSERQVQEIIQRSTNQKGN